MSELKAFVLLAAALAAFGAFAASASATELSAETENGMVATGSTIAAEAEGTTVLHPPFGNIECKKSGLSGKTTNTGGATETVSASIESLSFSECNATVTVLTKGTLEVHTRTESADGNGTLTSNGTEVTVEFVGTHCIFKTSNTDIGTLTGTQATRGSATLDIAATIARTGGRSGAFCGSTAQWTGSYKVTNPSAMTVDFLCTRVAAGKGNFTTWFQCVLGEPEEFNLGSWTRP
ncbi:MAG TPA: hypothetical protein VFX44_07050 [Solirubrobacterales bacterium]|nr:hypothetical protein [Solirubrobacterales bacterium]